jgi:hypothetical protein
MSGQAGDSKEEKLAAALFEAFKLDDPAINMVHRPHYSPKTTLDGCFDLRKIASQVLFATTTKTN